MPRTFDCSHNNSEHCRIRRGRNALFEKSSQKQHSADKGCGGRRPRSIANNERKTQGNPISSQINSGGQKVWLLKKGSCLLDVDLALVWSASLLRQPPKPSLEVSASGLNVTWLALKVLTIMVQRLVSVSSTSRDWEKGDDGLTGKKFLMSDVGIFRSNKSFLFRNRIWKRQGFGV